ncbi:MAG: chromosomal replication initiator protein DnaA [Okeania sp. SIO1H5]|uniref:chromosomal replication initiator protein DnaA n=1 Tax=Okeania sp. SIO1H5 TaxID=2607777 RepID=UPI0013BC2C20|nr:chromosomal replication initiator protein DnaA [Okeania sp. SIO1H5]NET23573.1 chromosomal replication initiator protein DnaA [Okeania sp. SIO1H5]
MVIKNSLVESEHLSLWEQSLSLLSEKIPESAFNTWFNALEILDVNHDTVSIGVPNEFVLEYVSHHYYATIQVVLQDLLQKPVQLIFKERARTSLELLEAKPEKARSSSPEDLHKSKDVNVDVTVPLPRNNNFDSFVIGDCNQLAHAACLAVSQAPSKNSFNPLVIYGGTGMGKTHLLQAIAHFCSTNETVSKIVYRTSEEFTQEYIKFVKKMKDSRTFYQVYNDADILLIDDIQFLAGKQSTQDEFYSIFNVLQGMKKQIVITSDRPPAEIKGLHQRLLSRFDTGLLADLQPPNLETRLAILKKKNDADQSDCITDEVLCYVANHVTSNVRELEGTLIKLSAYACFTRTPITVEIAKEILGDTVRNVNQPITIKRILETVAVDFESTVNLLVSQTRKKNVAVPRQIAMYLARKLTDNSLHTIGLAFGRDYSTVIHSLKKVESEMKLDNALRVRVDRLQNSLS